MKLLGLLFEQTYKCFKINFKALINIKIHLDKYNFIIGILYLLVFKRSNKNPKIINF